MRLGFWSIVVMLAAFLAAPVAGAAEPAIHAGMGRSDITPPAGYAFGGWTRADRTGQGVHTRLYASALVLESGGEKTALVSIDLFAAPGGLVKDIAAAAGAGFSERNVLVSASHTHAGPGGFANFDTLNTVAPSPETIDRPSSFVELLSPRPTDRQLYGLLVDRISAAIRRAERSSAPAAIGWGTERLTTVTRNRSLEAHLADHGLTRARGAGKASEDPDGTQHTIDPDVNVLRVDRISAQGTRPLGAWSSFANHGTVNPSEFEVYNQDHHGPANRVFEGRVRRAAGLEPGRALVNVYGNSNEGDLSAGLDGQGPAVTDRVGTAEGKSMFSAWRRAGRALERRPTVDRRWTRTCFCGQAVKGGGRVADSPLPGLPFLTGSEEGRGPLFDLTGVPLEDIRTPSSSGAQGNKVGIPAASNDSFPRAVPLMVVRVADRMIASMPGEPTVEMGRRVRAAVLARARGSGVREAIVSGLANEFVLYLTTPEEYGRQHYEGGSTLFGPHAASLLRDELAGLAGRIARGQRPPKPFALDPRNGVVADHSGFGPGAADAVPLTQPRAAVGRCGYAEFGWRGGDLGTDRPFDRPFVIVQRRVAGDWQPITDDLGLQIVWTVEQGGRYLARWEVPPDAPTGRHRLRISARRYSVASRPFTVSRAGPRSVATPVGDGYRLGALSAACAG